MEPALQLARDIGINRNNSNLFRMKLEYQVYKSYNPEATIEIDLTAFIIKILNRLGVTLESIFGKNQSIPEEFYKRVISEWSQNEGMAVIDHSIVDHKKIEKEFPILIEQQDLLNPATRFILSHLKEQETKVETPSKTTVLYIDRERAENILFFEIVKVLVEILGREEGIRVYKKAVDHLADKHAKLEPDSIEMDQFRKNFTGGLSDSGGFSFAIANMDDHMLLGKFDRCVVHESLKDVSDPELGYLVTCYTGMTMGNQRNLNIQMRRTQTLFNGNFCDELYWDPRIHENPEQPSLEVSRNLRLE